MSPQQDGVPRQVKVQVSGQQAARVSNFMGLEMWEAVGEEGDNVELWALKCHGGDREKLGIDKDSLEFLRTTIQRPETPPRFPEYQKLTGELTPPLLPAYLPLMDRTPKLDLALLHETSAAEDEYIMKDDFVLGSPSSAKPFLELGVDVSSSPLLRHSEEGKVEEPLVPLLPHGELTKARVELPAPVVMGPDPQSVGQAEALATVQLQVEQEQLQIEDAVLRVALPLVDWKRPTALWGSKSPNSPSLNIKGWPGTRTVGAQLNWTPFYGKTRETVNEVERESFGEAAIMECERYVGASEAAVDRVLVPDDSTWARTPTRLPTPQTPVFERPPQVRPTSAVPGLGGAEEMVDMLDERWEGGASGARRSGGEPHTTSVLGVGTLESRVDAFMAYHVSPLRVSTDTGTPDLAAYPSRNAAGSPPTPPGNTPISRNPSSHIPKKRLYDRDLSLYPPNPEESPPEGSVNNPVFIAESTDPTVDHPHPYSLGNRPHFEDASPNLSPNPMGPPPRRNGDGAVFKKPRVSENSPSRAHCAGSDPMRERFSAPMVKAPARRQSSTEPFMESHPRAAERGSIAVGQRSGTAPAPRNQGTFVGSGAYVPGSVIRSTGSVFWTNFAGYSPTKKPDLPNPNI